MEKLGRVAATLAERRNAGPRSPNSSSLKTVSDMIVQSHRKIEQNHHDLTVHVQSGSKMYEDLKKKGTEDMEVRVWLCVLGCIWVLSRSVCAFAGTERKAQSGL